MTPELTVLALAALLQAMQLALFAIPANIELGPGKTLSPRDKDRMPGPLDEQVSKTTARLYRAYNNHFEALAFFSIAVLVVELSDQNSRLTALCAHTYLIARILYIPAYAQGLVPWRSLIWAIGFAATLTMLGAALL
ncbi:MAG: MAPEG family protein [Pseudomonadota bacterium]